MYRGSNITAVNVRGFVCIIYVFLNYFYDVDPLRPFIATYDRPTRIVYFVGTLVMYLIYMNLHTSD